MLFKSQLVLELSWNFLIFIIIPSLPSIQGSCICSNIPEGTFFSSKDSDFVCYVKRMRRGRSDRTDLLDFLISISLVVLNTTEYH
jgi:hypothetical protein